MTSKKADPIPKRRRGRPPLARRMEAPSPRELSFDVYGPWHYSKDRSGFMPNNQGKRAVALPTT